MKPNVKPLLAKGLNAIFSKLEAELSLQDAFKILWNTDSQCIRTDTELSAVTRTDTRYYSVHGEEEGSVELKVNLVTCGRYVFRGNEMPREIVNDDIIAQIRVCKQYNDPAAEVVSQENPYGIMARFADLHLFDRSAGPMQLLCEYVRALYKAGFRVCFHAYEPLRLDLWMVKEDVQVKITFYVADFIHTRLLLAHKNDAYK